MKTDAHLVNDQYSWLTTIFYLGYMLGEFPINYLFQKFDIARTCGIFIILWGTVLLCMTAGHNFAGLTTARLFLGILEAGVSPCFVLLTAMFYRRSVLESTENLPIFPFGLRRPQSGAASANMYLVFYEWSCKHHRWAHCLWSRPYTLGSSSMEIPIRNLWLYDDSLGLRLCTGNPI